MKVKCKTNIEFETEEQSVIFQPSIDPQVDETLEFKESYEAIRRESLHVSIYITNPSNHKIVLYRRDLLGTLHNISSNTNTNFKAFDIDIHEISQEVHTDKENYYPEEGTAGLSLTIIAGTVQCIFKNPK